MNTRQVQNLNPRLYRTLHPWFTPQIQNVSQSRFPYRFEGNFHRLRYSIFQKSSFFENVSFWLEQKIAKSNPKFQVNLKNEEIGAVTFQRIKNYSNRLRNKKVTASQSWIHFENLRIFNIFVPVLRFLDLYANTTKLRRHIIKIRKFEKRISVFHH